MQIRELSVHGYRGFAEPSSVTFAIPNGAAGSGLTILVGSNNAGKSSIVEALHFLSRPGAVPVLDAARRNGSTGGRLTIRYELENGTIELKTPAAGGEPAWAMNQLTVSGGQVFVVPSRRSLPRTFSKTGPLDRVNYAASESDPASRSPSSGNFVGRLTTILQNREAFDAILGDVLGEVPTWYIEELPGGSRQSYFNFCAGTSPHSSEGVGDGFVTLVYVADALHDSKADDIIVLDEPELSLHPAAQRRLAQVIAEYAKTRQIVVATHSPYFADWEYLFNGANLARVYTRRRGTATSNLTRETVNAASKLSSISRNPHVLGLEAREVFFLRDQVVLVEGQDDVIDYPDLARKLGVRVPGDFYGWGVGGAQNMPMIAAILADLGFERVAGLLDAGQGTTLTELRSKFPKFGFACIDAPNVRTKAHEKEREEKRGLLDEKRRVRRDIAEKSALLMLQLAEFLNTGVASPGSGFSVFPIPNGVAMHLPNFQLPPDDQLGEPLGV